MPKPGVLLYFGDMEIIEKMSDAEAGEFLRAILAYAQYGAEPSFDSLALEIAWVPVKKSIDKDSKAYENKLKASAYAVYCREAKRSGIPPLDKETWMREVFPDDMTFNISSDDNERYRTITNNSSNIQSQYPIPISNSSSKTTRTRAEATGHGDTPTVEEIKKYCSDRGYTFPIDRFMDKYSKMNWENVDWKDAADGWQRRQREPKRNSQYQKHGKLSDAGRKAVQELLEQEDTE